MKTLKRVSCLLLVIAMLVSVLATTVVTSSAATPLTHLVQTESKWKYYIGGGTLYNTGCGIFSMRNAIGYLTGYDIGIDAPARWAHSIGAYNVTGGEGTYRLVLYPKITAKYGGKAGFKVINESTWAGASNTTLKAHLANGGVAIGHVPGHFIALVDYNYNTNKFHVLDSAPSTARGTTSGYGDCWVTQSRLSTGKLKLDWFCLLSATGTPADEQDNEKGLLATAIANAEDKRYDQYTDSGIDALRTAYDNAVSVYNNASSTSADYKAARTTLENAMKSSSSSIISKGKSYTVTNSFYTNGEAQTDNGVKLTDGSKGNSDGGTDKFFASKGSTEIVVDLGSVQNSNIYKIYMTAGDWGVAVPYGDQLDLNIKVSNDKTTWKNVGAVANSIRTGVKNGNWETLTLTLTTDTIESARYVKFGVTSYATNNFVWLDEVEVISGEPLLSGHVYVNGMNQKIGSGDCFVFTPKFGQITVDTANHAWTANIVAKWVEGNKYEVTSKTFGIGPDTPAINLANGEILIAANNWETGVTDGSAIAGSAANTNTLNSVQVGDIIAVDGIDSNNSKLDVVAYVSIQSAATGPVVHEHNPGEVTCLGGQVCLSCGEVLAAALGHDEGRWVQDENMEHLMCNKCDEILDTREIVIDGVGEEKPEESSDVVEESSDVIEESSDVVEESSDVIEESSDVVEESSDVVEDSSEDEESSDVSDESSDGDHSADPEPEPNFVGYRGDLNDNGKIDMTDYILLKRYYFNTYDLSGDQLLLADIDVNNKINMTDYIILKRIYFGTYKLLNAEVWR